MATLLTGNDEIFARWCGKRIPNVGEAGFGPCRTVAVATGKEASDRIMAVFVFHDYQPKFGTVQLSGAAIDSHWVSRSTVRGILAVPFLQYRCHLVWSAIPHASDRVIRLAKALGFKQEAILKDRFGRGNHAVIVRLENRDYSKRYFRETDAQKAAA